MPQRETVAAALLGQQDGPRFGRPALLPRRTRRLARAGAQAIEQLLILGIVLEEIEQHVGELGRGRKEEAVVRVADALGQTAP